MQVLGFLFQSEGSTVLTAVVATGVVCGLASWLASLDRRPTGKRRKR